MTSMMIKIKQCLVHQNVRCTAARSLTLWEIWYSVMELFFKSQCFLPLAMHPCSRHMYLMYSCMTSWQYQRRFPYYTNLQHRKTWRMSPAVMDTRTTCFKQTTTTKGLIFFESRWGMLSTLVPHGTHLWDKLSACELRCLQLSLDLFPWWSLKKKLGAPSILFVNLASWPRGHIGSIMGHGGPVSFQQRKISPQNAAVSPNTSCDTPGDAICHSYPFSCKTSH